MPDRRDAGTISPVAVTCPSDTSRWPPRTVWISVGGGGGGGKIARLVKDPDGSTRIGAGARPDRIWPHAGLDREGFILPESVPL